MAHDFKEGDRVALLGDWHVSPGHHRSWVAKAGHRGTVLSDGRDGTHYPRVRLDVHSWDALSDAHIPPENLRLVHELEVLADEAKKLGFGEAS